MEGPAEFLFDERYAEAFFHVGKHRVLGLELKPFSAWHRSVLEYINSPVMTGGELTAPDLRMAVKVCTLSYPDIPQPFPDGLWHRLKAEHQSRKDQRVLARETAAFWRYISDYLSPPYLMVNKKGEGSQLPDVDQTLMDVALYRFYTGSPRSEPWDIPIGELIWMNAAIAKTQGADLHVVSTQEEQMLRNLKNGRTI